MKMDRLEIILLVSGIALIVVLIIGKFNMKNREEKRIQTNVEMRIENKVNQLKERIRNLEDNGSERRIE